MRVAQVSAALQVTPAVTEVPAVTDTLWFSDSAENVRIALAEVCLKTPRLLLTESQHSASDAPAMFCFWKLALADSNRLPLSGANTAPVPLLSVITSIAVPVRAAEAVVLAT